MPLVAFEERKVSLDLVKQRQHDLQIYVTVVVIHGGQGETRRGFPVDFSIRWSEVLSSIVKGKK